jgi:predicted lipoprotein with Yx(FWY)xxD motif
MRNPGRAPLLITGALLAVTLAVTGCGKDSYSAGSPPGGAYGTPASSMPATSSASSGAVQGGVLKTETTSAGTVLASSHGLTLYYYAEDKQGSGRSVCTGGCASAWPPLTAPVRAPAGVRLPGPLGMITRPGGIEQVTINGYPVYFYSGDKAPGQATGNGYEGAWHVIKIHAAATTRTLTVERTSAGTVLAGVHGYTLYYYTEDKPGSGKSVCTGGCAKAWPPLVAPVKAPAGMRLPGRLGMITRPGGLRQATLNGYPLYTYAGDKAPGQATGNGIGGAWHVINIKAS